MMKPASLRAFLTAAVADLQRDPERLQIFIEGGKILSPGDPLCADHPRAFEYRYRLQLIITDFAGHPDALFSPLVSWVASNQRELLAPGNADGVKFETEILSHDLADVSIELELSEVVVPVQRPDGGWMLDHPAEPAIDAACCTDAPLKIYLGDELIATWQPAA
ncbi:MAG: phage tail protein [Caulobacter sp.]|nr:phage tail protein [Caulobacter sp.]